jgi:prophage antirepressor-like protein
MSMDSTTYLLKIDPQTIFINHMVLQLIIKSRNPECEKFAEWLSKEIIPSLINICNTSKNHRYGTQ